MTAVIFLHFGLSLLGLSAFFNIRQAKVTAVIFPHFGLSPPGYPPGWNLGVAATGGTPARFETDNCYYCGGGYPPRRLY